MKTLKNMRRKNLCITLGLVSLLSGGANAALQKPTSKTTETIRLIVTNDCPVTITAFSPSTTVGVSSTKPITLGATVTTADQCVKAGARVWLWGTGFRNKWVLQHTTNTTQKYTLQPDIDGNADFLANGTDATIHKKLTMRDKTLRASVNVNPQAQVLIPGEYTMTLHAGINF
ncbi:aggregative adherence fimbria I major subunit AggA [Escherichia coli]|uniref:aggregative adherence fimbria I major subunit AggA n=1 Tax=Escherichia coli TaxID=562 RepID=UPI0003916C72|nr:aggregative adherence fimbria I major subunit AggA [Escherichia coli]EFB4413631.1 aggregative adherence fimbria I major subunit AggA [Escherichia coli]EFB4515194.1 aggregative adherence fimbria I major subunit AggA [Escherichia coli]EFC3688473.1 aggregative adherence fimbria I major subunit AggA [Escherichia coli]EFD9632062.1 aggregative adherence fimbria I major subunit AggA [Escherichia coli]EFF9639078.1 aggregative adherence fimbria I major subunit AggA [Escherichia coli]